MSTDLQVLDMSLPIGSLDAYIYRVNQIPMLSKEEEQQLAATLHEEGDLTAAKHLIMPHLRYVVRVARGYRGYGLPLADLIQEGNVGLMKAVKRFDPAFGVRLVSFAVHWIKAEIHEYIIRNWRIVKVATTKAQRKLFFNLRGCKKRLGWFTRQEVESVAKDLGVPEKDVLVMEQRLNAMDYAYDAPDVDDDNSHAYAPVHYLESDNSDPAALIEAATHSAHEKQHLIVALRELDSRSLDILQQRWLNDKKATLHELADKYDVSAERIRQIEQNALKKLKKLIAE